jgi:hypothetical protein
MLLRVNVAVLGTVPGSTKLLTPWPPRKMLNKIELEPPTNLKPTTRLRCECGGLGLYLVVGIFVNFNDVFNLRRFCVDLDLRGIWML